MAERVERVSKVTTPVNTEQITEKEVTEVSEVAPSGATLAERIIWYVAGVLLVLLAFRFVLALLGANPNNGFANFIYTTSHPFVAPFFNLFGYNLQYGVSRFETYTLVAMAVYAVIAYGLARLVTLGRPSTTAP
jgi:uncharacterized protein YggT (Ycf19 family)